MPSAKSHLFIFYSVAPCVKDLIRALLTEFYPYVINSMTCLKVLFNLRSLVSCCVWWVLEFFLHGSWGFPLWIRIYVYILFLTAIGIISLLLGQLHVTVWEDWSCINYWVWYYYLIGWNIPDQINHYLILTTINMSYVKIPGC